MPGACCKSGGGKKHTPITSGKQQGLFGGAYGAKKKRKGKPHYVPKSLWKEPMSVLGMHLEESAGKKLPKKVRKKGKKK